MAVTERWKERKYGRSIDDKGVMSFTAELTWDTDGPTTESEAIDSVPEAAIGAGHPRSGDLVVSSNGATEERKGLWAVRATYTTNPQGDGGSNGGEPTVTFEWEDGTESFQTDTDIFGNALVNSALDPFEGGGTREVDTGTYTVTINQPFFDAKEAAKYRGKVFDDELVTPFGTFAPLESKCTSIRPVTSVIPKQTLIKVAFRIEIRPKDNWPKMPETMSPWDFSFVDQGVHGWSDAGKAVQIVEPENPLSYKSALLNGEGIPLDPTSSILYRKATPKGLGASPTGSTIQERTKCKVLYYFARHRAQSAALNLPSRI